MTWHAVTWHPDAVQRALDRLVAFRDYVGIELRPEEQAVAVAIDALRMACGQAEPGAPVTGRSPE